MAGASRLSEDVDLDIAAMLANVWRQKWVLLLLTFLSGALLYIVFSQLEPRYSATTRILIESRESVFTRPGDTNGTQQFDREAIGSQMQIIASDDLLLQVIEKLDLVNNREFASSSSSTLGLLLSAFVPQASTNANVTPEERVLGVIRKRLSTYIAENSRVIVVEFWAHDRTLARDLPNAIADAYLASTREDRAESNEAATDWLGPEVQDLRQRVKDAEAKVAEFRTSSDMLTGTNNALLANQQLSEVSSELSRVRAERTAAEAKIDTIRSSLANGTSIDTIPEVLASPLVQSLREKQVDIQARISDLSSTLLPNHPKIRALRSQLPDYDRQIRQAAGNIVKSLENAVSLARKQEEVLVQEVNRLKAEASRVAEAEVELRALERDAASQRTLLESYLTRYREANSRQSRDYVPVDARIISRATLPVTAYFPKTLPMVLGGMFATLLLGIVTSLAIQLLNGSALRRVPAMGEMDVPERVVAERAMIANAPGLAPEHADLTIADAPRAEPQSATVDNDSDGFSIKFAAQAREGIGRSRVVIVTPGGDEGSPAGWVLARYLAKRNRSVAVVDLTGDAITTRAMLGTSDLPGLFNVLSGRATLVETIYEDRESSAHVLPAGKIDSAGASASLDRLKDLLAQLDKAYDYTLVDCGYAGLDGIARVAREDTVVVVSTAGSDLSSARALENDLRNSGYSEAILVRSEEPANSEVVAA